MKTIEAANIAAMGEVYPKISEAACANAHMLAIIETRGYSAIASCVIMHIITNIELKESERLYYILADLYANYSRAKNNSRSVTIPGVLWAQHLGLREEYVFVLQKSLEEKGYFVDNKNNIRTVKGDYSTRSSEYSARSGDFSENYVSSNKDLTSNSFCNKNINHQILGPDDVVDVNLNKNHEKTSTSMQTSQKFNIGLFDLDIVHEKYQKNLQKLTKEQAQKAINYAKKLMNDVSCSEFLHGVSQDELIRQFIHHAANFKPTKIYCETRNEEVDVALSFAYMAVKKGSWRCPSGWGDAIDLHLEKEKYSYENNDSKQLEQFVAKVGRYLHA